MQENSFDQPYPPEKQGMGCLPKVLIGLAVGGAVCLALCCGLGWYFTSQAMKTTEEPAEIEEIRRGIVNIDLPEDMPPSFGGEFNFGMFQMEMAGYGEQQGKFLMLMQMQVAGLSEEEMKQQFRQQAAQQQNESVRITNSETRTRTIDGQPEEFVFAFKVPKAIDVLPELPKSGVGKSGSTLTSANIATSPFSQSILAAGES